MSHETDGFVRPKGQWDCFLINGRKGDIVYTSGPNNEPRAFQKIEIEPYPDYVTAAEDFVGGLRYEIFRVIDPWETLGRDGCLHVECRQGQLIKLPATIALKSPAWVSCAVAV